MRADAVFEGGGARGIAFVGAIQAMEEEKVEWQRIAGTSAGAVIAALLASGYKSNEIKKFLSELDFSKLRGRTFMNRIPIVGSLLELLFHLGIYKNDYLEAWVDSLLLKKGIKTFADLPNGKLKIIASDVSNGQMLVLPDDLERYRMTPADLKVSTAVMMSASIPFFYRPVIWKSKDRNTSYILDGGLLSNFPIWIFDTPDPRFPTFGFRFVKDKVSIDPVIPTPLHLFKNIFKTMLQAHDLRHLNEDTLERTIKIPTGDINATDFNLNKEEIDFLYQSGYTSTKKFLSVWDFEQHKSNRLQRIKKTTPFHQE
ncbi:patatin-like phospholipase family protein [Neobacillus niacini]|uniref:patatin-like phospholipase family protein n=1 Tax=Neobacillus niacini TaxID=86668 RepID=UPI00052FACF6|nr:patatin-like phospholipase family protein [Neobacillus niacini]KGM45648.1 phospholipase [Neobacillus niacini]MEC1525485.1 patatin-like phospholipase family protein [Neobacillus niacini]